MPTATPTIMPTATASNSEQAAPVVSEQNSFGLTLPLNDIEYNNGFGTFVFASGELYHHDGYDVRSASGDNRVFSMATGKVAWVNTEEAAVGIRSENGLEITYTHVDAAAKGLLKKDQEVQQNEHIGNYGIYGDTTYEHLHTTIRVGPERYKVDPAPYWPTGRPNKWIVGSLSALPTVTSTPK